MGQMEMLFFGVVLFVLLMIFSGTRFACRIAILLVLVSGMRILQMFIIPPEDHSLCMFQLLSGFFMFSGLLLRKMEKGSPSLLMRAILHGTTDFSAADLKTLMVATDSFRRLILHVAAILCLLAFVFLLLYGFIETNRELLFVSSIAAEGDFAQANTIHLHALKDLYPVLFPLLVGLVLAEFLLYIPDSTWFRNASQTLLAARSRGVPSYYWAFPAMIIFLVWFRHLFSLLATL